MPAKPRLTREAWIDAAISMVIERGVSSLAVEPLAATVGATKGSFYWHFANRAAILDAVLDSWESSATADVIRDVDSATDPLLALLTRTTHAGRAEGLEWALLSALDHPQVAETIMRVHRTRLRYLQQTLALRGLSASASTARARLAYAAYLGNLQLSVCGVPLSAAGRKTYVREVAAIFDTES